MTTDILTKNCIICNRTFPVESFRFNTKARKYRDWRCSKCFNKRRRDFQINLSIVNYPILKRFWSKVLKSNECWLWQGRPDGDGYGRFYIGPSVILAHRFSAMISKPDFTDYVCALHRCDTPLCVRPSHLFLGTQAENVQDMVAKGRHIKGEAVPESKLKVAEVAEIKIRLQGECNKSQIAREYNVTPSTINAIDSGITWKHV